jgi:hypothetical protein
METPAQQCTRLLAALKDLLAEESVLIGAQDYAAVTRIQERAAPLVERLAALAPAADIEARASAISVMALRNQNLERMAAQIAAVEGALEQTREARSRLTQVAPAYRSSPPIAVRRLRAIG